MFGYWQHYVSGLRKMRNLRRRQVKRYSHLLRLNFLVDLNSQRHFQSQSQNLLDFLYLLLILSQLYFALDWFGQHFVLWKPLMRLGLFDLLGVQLRLMLRLDL